MTLNEIAQKIDADSTNAKANSVSAKTDLLDKQTSKRNMPLKMIKPRTSFRRTKKSTTKPR